MYTRLQENRYIHIAFIFSDKCAQKRLGGKERYRHRIHGYDNITATMADSKEGEQKQSEHDSAYVVLNAARAAVANGLRLASGSVAQVFIIH